MGNDDRNNSDRGRQGLKELYRALAPFRRRIRAVRCLRGAAAGGAAGLACAALMLALSFFVPIPAKAAQAGCAAGALLLGGAVIGALRPVTYETAAREADRCGLRERAVTALEYGAQEGFGALVREDACRALRGLDPKRIPAGCFRGQLLTALGCAAVCGVLLLIPSPQDGIAAERQMLRGQLKAGQEMLQKAEEADEKSLSEAERTALRRLTEELRRELDAGKDRADALIALDRAERRLEQLRQKTAGDAIGQASAAEDTRSGKAAGESGEGGNASAQSAEAASGGMKGENQKGETKGSTAQGQAGAETGERQAGESGPEDTTGEPAGEQQEGAAGGENAAGQQTGEAIRAIRSMVSAGAAAASAGGEGKSAVSGSSGSGAGMSQVQSAGGAGKGSTNEEEKGSGSGSQSVSVRGSEDPRYKEGRYETIYDPEHTDAAFKNVMTEQKKMNEDEPETEAGPGRGFLSGDVPYGQVLREYAEAESLAADREALTEKQKQWVTDYFVNLTEQQ